MLALFVGYILIAILGSQVKFSWQIMAMHALLWTMMVFAFNTGLTILWVFAVLIAGVSFYYTMNKLINR